jgi:hypothetical protein
MIEDVGDPTVLAGASTPTGATSGEPAEQPGASDDPADGDPLTGEELG